ncbi:MAG: hypothetical protein GWN61_16255, partial [candidate division Zixibacteria bacterium]|nr:penicillin acylase family protein [candidate division KSB1 bacterium]NIV07679.1 hypothetical protein [candidate division Zixibacteria bacterium]NIS26084.1 penicillin acylase family protein [candidate division KSB1 bacterium]NIT72883.1 penicillin acylase family protein [candidate division KSB1 bacterium]NIU26726.1 penicillin acylase family protein [candidate division KSB1 bacterium]
DWSDVDAFTINTNIGQSGNPFSPHYDDFFETMRKGNRWTVPFTREAVFRMRSSLLRLLPEKTNYLMSLDFPGFENLEGLVTLTAVRATSHNHPKHERFLLSADLFSTPSFLSDRSQPRWCHLRFPKFPMCHPHLPCSPHVPHDVWIP